MQQASRVKSGMLFVSVPVDRGGAGAYSSTNNDPIEEGAYAEWTDNLYSADHAV